MNTNYQLLSLYGTARDTLNSRDVIAAIKAGLQARSGKSWSVTRGRGTAYGWLTISSPPARRVNNYYMSDADRAELAGLLGFDRPVHTQGVSIAAGHDYYREYLSRSAGLTPLENARPYWD
jgi:hypothetical protein